MRKILPSILVYLIFSIVLTSLGAISAAAIQTNRSISDQHEVSLVNTEAVFISSDAEFCKHNPFEHIRYKTVTPFESNEEDEDEVLNDVEGRLHHSPIHDDLNKSNSSLAKYSSFKQDVLAAAKVSLVILLHSWKSHCVS